MSKRRKEQSRDGGAGWGSLGILLVALALVTANKGDGAPTPEQTPRGMSTRLKVFYAAFAVFAVVATVAWVVFLKGSIDESKERYKAERIEQAAQAGGCLSQVEQRIRSELPSQSADMVMQASIEPLRDDAVDPDSYGGLKSERVYVDADEFCVMVDSVADLAIIDEKLNLVLARETAQP